GDGDKQNCREKYSWHNNFLFQDMSPLLGRFLLPVPKHIGKIAVYLYIILHGNVTFCNLNKRK
ncbi:MAG: hypothetical protein RR011_05190, partial [Oscillospiraceae bacterium]